MSSTIDFNGAETQDAALAVIPSGTLARVRLSIRPGGTGPEGWLTQSRTSEALYLNTEAVVLEGPFARRRIYTRIGIKGRAVNERGEDVYASRGRALIRGILESARGVRTGRCLGPGARGAHHPGLRRSQRPRAAGRIGIDRDRANPQDEGRNVIAAAHRPRSRRLRPAHGRATAPVAAPAPAAHRPVGPPAGGQYPGAGNAPFWAR